MHPGRHQIVFAQHVVRHDPGPGQHVPAALAIGQRQCGAHAIAVNDRDMRGASGRLGSIGDLVAVALQQVGIQQPLGACSGIFIQPGVKPRRESALQRIGQIPGTWIAWGCFQSESDQGTT